MRELLRAAALMAATAGAGQPIEIRPQPGPQEMALSSRADIVVMGGAAGGGKTYALLLEPVRHHRNPHFGGVVFRRTYPQIKNEGGLWEEAGELYPLLGAKPNENDLRYEFPAGASVRFAHLQHAKDRYAWKGAQVPWFGFDQLEEFEEVQFWYMLSRNRSARAGFRPYVWATVNPVPDDDPIGGWVNKLLAWWWNPDTGYAIPERSGVLRWFVRVDETIHWADTPVELRERFEGCEPKSLTFILAKLSDNQVLEGKDPGYRANLMALPLVERERLLGGNWKIKPTAGLVFNRAWFPILPALPTDVVAWIRYWDKAGTQDGGKYSAGVLMGKRPDGSFLIADVVRGQWSALNREKVIKQTAEADRALGRSVAIWVEQEPGSGGKESAENTVRSLAGFTIHAERVTGDKLTRAQPLSAQSEAKNVFLAAAPWNEAWLSEAQNFDGIHGVMDQIDASSGAFNKLTGGPQPARLRPFAWG